MCKLTTIKKADHPINLKESFGKHVVNRNAVADSVFTDNNLNLKEKAQDVQQNISALNPENNIELLLASQIMAVHNYQQRLISYAINTENVDSSVKYGNLAAKLSNVFIQQVTLMQKLKGINQQKVVFEHVHIHSGGQAIVGAVNTNHTPYQDKT
jgi:tetrahydromethanopterin S-methyltransferase subunit E